VKTVQWLHAGGRAPNGKSFCMCKNRSMAACRCTYLMSMYGKELLENPCIT
jgi:hypothetical protein